MGRVFGGDCFIWTVREVGRWLIVGFTPIFFAFFSLLIFIKRLQIAVICVYLQKIKI